MIKTVLVPVDGSPTAETGLPYMELMASRTGAALHLVNALERDDEDPALGETITYLEGVADRLRSQSLSCSREVSTGEATDARVGVPSRGRARLSQRPRGIQRA